MIKFIQSHSYPIISMIVMLFLCITLIWCKPTYKANANEYDARVATITSAYERYVNATSIGFLGNYSCVEFKVEGQKKIICGNFDIVYN